MAAIVREVLWTASEELHFTDGELELLLRELEMFGGNSLRNLARDGGVDYEEIAADVLKHVSGETPEGADIAELELRILAAIVTRLWAEGDDRRQGAIASQIDPGHAGRPDLLQTVRKVLGGGQPAIAAAALAAGFEDFTFRRLAGTMSVKAKEVIRNPKSLVTALAARSAPAAAALATAAAGVNQIAGEAYRITMPCVVRIAAIRQKQLLRRQCAAQATMRTAAASPGSPVVPPVWHVGTIESRSIVAASFDLAPEWRRGARALEPASIPGIDRLAPLLHAMPGLAAAMQQQSAQYVRVVVNGPLAKAADGNGLRGWVHDGTKFVEQARFYEDARLRNLVNSAAVFNIASTVVAQKHLADIQARLEAVEKGVLAIRAFQQDERKSTIEGSVTYLRQVGQRILGGDPAPDVRPVLEKLELELIRCQDHLETDLRNLSDSLTNLKVPPSLGTSALAALLKGEQIRFQALIEQWTLCQCARLAGSQLIEISDPGANLESRRQDLVRSATGMCGEGGIAEKISKLLEERTRTMSSLVESKSEIRARQLSLERRASLMLQPTLDRMRTQGYTPTLSSAREPDLTVALALRIDQAGCFEAYHLEAHESQLGERAPE